MIYANSRYENVDQEFVPAPGGGRRRVIGFPQFYAVDFDARKHIMSQYERLEQLAARYYGDPEMWWVIAVANPEIFYPEDIPPGTIVRIPDAPAIL